MAVPANSGIPPAPPAPPGAPGALAGYPALMELDRANAQEKKDLVQKLRTQIQDPAVKNKWLSFCQVHAHGQTNVEHHDMAFLATFSSSYESGTILTLEEFDHPADSGADGGDGTAPNNKIFVGGLPKGTQEDKLWSFFGQWGRVEKVDCKKDENGQPRGFAFVTFQDKAHAQQVVDSKDNYMDGKWIDCKLADGSAKGGGKDKGGKDSGKAGKDSGKGGKDGGKGGSGADDSLKIFVGGLPKTATQSSVSAFFSYYGTVDRVDLKYDPQGAPRGFGFVIFTSVDSASKALAKPQLEFEGKWIECKAATQGGDGGKDSGKGGKDKDSGKGGKDKDSGKGGKDKDNSWSAGGGDWKSGSDWKSSSDKWPSSDQGSRGSWSSSGGGDKWGGSDKRDSGNDSSWSSRGDDKNDSWSGRDSGSGGYGAAKGGKEGGSWGPY